MGTSPGLAITNIANYLQSDPQVVSADRPLRRGRAGDRFAGGSLLLGSQAFLLAESRCAEPAVVPFEDDLAGGLALGLAGAVDPDHRALVAPGATDREPVHQLGPPDAALGALAQLDELPQRIEPVDQGRLPLAVLGALRLAAVPAGSLVLAQDREGRPGWPGTARPCRPADPAASGPATGWPRSRRPAAAPRSRPRRRSPRAGPRSPSGWVAVPGRCCGALPWAGWSRRIR